MNSFTSKIIVVNNTAAEKLGQQGQVTLAKKYTYESESQRLNPSYTASPFQGCEGFCSHQRFRKHILQDKGVASRTGQDHKKDIPELWPWITSSVISKAIELQYHQCWQQGS